MASLPSGSGFTRRTLLGAGVSALAVGALAACSTSGGGGGGAGKASQPLKFWNQPWGAPAFLTEDQRIAAAYKPKSGFGKIQYRQVQWANFTQTYSTAVAANTGPAVSSGGGTQAFLFESQGKIAYADDLLDSWKKNGIYDDFLPGLVDTLKTKNGYAAVPYNLDMRLFWYRKDLLEKAGVQAPTTWDEFENVCKALKKQGIYGYGTYSGAGAFTGGHTLVAHMINNGGGLFNENQEVDAVTDANIQAMEWVIGLVKNGYVDPRSGTYTSANAYAQMNANKFGMIWDGAGTPANVNASVASNLEVGTPLTGPSGKKGALYFPNNIMMYKNTPSQAASEAFLTYYYQNMKTLWTKKTGIGLAPLQSIVKAAYADDPKTTAIVENWQPISKTWGAPGQNTVFLNVTKVDGTQPMINFAQTILAGKTDAKTALTTLQNALKSA
ncbi:ABC transporter substrate-binding protein [Amnibacterium kyonggiense]|uniref:Carbohydrate ABC transporter substrate-binding protein (CUT1 family) n=1 Tax=Amnibacterium kyonggiense TaxID=595671 RepID=A0A4V3EB79_9MICO|nr:extracellular solute-binding protein [Amnibacterium kyonggiense]TDS80664.1 carbohydrate ABC transporter substrate-binding protein (CUT1 family) [Amnibacterium kyonggiense]